MFSLNSEKKKKITRILVYFGFPALTLGLLGFLYLVVSASGLVQSAHVIPHSFECPLQNVENVSVDARGNIYCAVTIFQRVQVYDRSGEFQRGWFVPSAGGVFLTRALPSGEVEVGCARRSGRLVYSSQGELISDEPDEGFYRKLLAALGRGTGVAPPGYEVEKGILGANVHRKRADGKWDTVVRSSIWKALFIGLPAWFFQIIFGMTALHIAEKIDPGTVNFLLGPRKKRKKPRFRRRSL